MTIPHHLDRLEKLCEGATPKRWLYRGGRVHGHIITEDGIYIFERGIGTRITADAAFIAAANPTVVRALVEVAKAAHDFINCPTEEECANECLMDDALAALEAAMKGEP